MPSDHPHALVDHLFRAHAGRMVAWLTRVFGVAHLALAEEVVQDSLLKALQQWRYRGVPDNPEGWLFRVARNAALDAVRRDAAFSARAAQIEAEIVRAAPAAPSSDGAIQDDELKLIFLCCHPSLSRDVSVALSLKVAAGFSVQEIARALLSSETTIAQRLVRAKRTLRHSVASLDLPAAHELPRRVESVLEVIYLIFTEGYGAHRGEDVIRLDLCAEALRLGRLVAGCSVVRLPAADALVSLMAFQAARLPARVDDSGEIVLLEDQDRALWDRGLIALGFRHLERSAEGPDMTPYHVQAAIAAVHARAAAGADTPWAEILALYDTLMAINPSPIVALNRAVVLAKLGKTHEALAIIGTLEDERALDAYHLLHSARARMLETLGNHEAAAASYRAALTCGCTEPERRFLERRLKRCAR